MTAMPLPNHASDCKCPCCTGKGGEMRRIGETTMKKQIGTLVPDQLHTFVKASGGASFIRFLVQQAYDAHDGAPLDPRIWKSAESRRRRERLAGGPS